MRTRTIRSDTTEAGKGSGGSFPHILRFERAGSRRVYHLNDEGLAKVWAALASLMFDQSGKTQELVLDGRAQIALAEVLAQPCAKLSSGTTRFDPLTDDPADIFVRLERSGLVGQGAGPIISFLNRASAILLLLSPVLIAISAFVYILLQVDQGQDIVRAAETDHGAAFRLACALALLAAAAGASLSDILSFPQNRNGRIGKAPALHAKQTKSDVVFAVSLLLALWGALLLTSALGLGAISVVVVLGGTVAGSMVALPLAFAARRFPPANLTIGATVLCCLAAIPEMAGRALGSAPILALALSGWLLVVAGFVRMAHRKRISGAFVAMIIFIGLWFSVVSSTPPIDRIRAVTSLDAHGAAPSVTPMLSFKSALFSLLDRQAESRPVVVLVSAAGGGVRASYWTAKVLARLTQASPALRDRLFLASGVSGGSLGLALYRALLAEPDLACAPDGRLEDCVATFHDADFLAGLLAGALTHDLLSAVLPISPQRGATLEKTWEAQWRRIAPSSDRFAEPFRDLFSTTGPSLVLNTTATRDGDRVPISNLDTKGWLMSRSRCKVNIAEEVNLPLSAAAHASARFPVISDWASFEVAAARRAGCESLETVADGGFFENYGAATVLDAYRQIKKLTATLPEARKPRVIVIQIVNDPDCDAARLLEARSLALECEQIIAQRKEAYKKRDVSLLPWRYVQADWNYNATLNIRRLIRPTPSLDPRPGPFGVMLRSRTMAGIEVADQLRRVVLAADDVYHLFSMAGAVDAPLGWTLSQTARRQLDERLDAVWKQPQIENLINTLSAR